MPIRINQESNLNLVNMHASGKVEKADCDHFFPEFEQLARQHVMAIFCKLFVKATPRNADHAEARITLSQA
jgi:hypothetical protein